MQTDRICRYRKCCKSLGQKRITEVDNSLIGRISDLISYSMEEVTLLSRRFLIKMELTSTIESLANLFLTSIISYSVAIHISVS